MSVSLDGTSVFLPVENTTSSNTTPRIRINSLNGEFQYYTPSDSQFTSMGQVRARYWRYVAADTINGHHPRCSRIMFHDENLNETVIIRYASDNTSDSGGIPNYDQSAIINYDFGTPVRIVGVSIFASFAVPGSTSGARSSRYRVEYSQNNSNWSTYFSGVMANHPAERGIENTTNSRTQNNHGIWYGWGSANNSVPVL